MYMSLYLPVVFVSVLFWVIAHFLTKENAKYLLSGYNTMSEEERKKFDIEQYLILFKKFFKQLSYYAFLFFLLVQFLFTDKTALIAWSVLISLAPLYLVIRAKEFKIK